MITGWMQSLETVRVALANRMEKRESMAIYLVYGMHTSEL